MFFPQRSFQRAHPEIEPQSVGEVKDRLAHANKNEHSNVWKQTVKQINPAMVPKVASHAKRLQQAGEVQKMVEKEFLGELDALVDHVKASQGKIDGWQIVEWSKDLSGVIDILLEGVNEKSDFYAAVKGRQGKFDTIHTKMSILGAKVVAADEAQKSLNIYAKDTAKRLKKLEKDIDAQKAKKLVENIVALEEAGKNCDAKVAELQQLTSNSKAADEMAKLLTTTSEEVRWQQEVDDGAEAQKMFPKGSKLEEKKFRQKLHDLKERLAALKVNLQRSEALVGRVKENASEYATLKSDLDGIRNLGEVSKRVDWAIVQADDIDDLLEIQSQLFEYLRALSPESKKAMVILDKLYGLDALFRGMEKGEELREQGLTMDDSQIIVPRNPIKSGLNKLRSAIPFFGSVGRRNKDNILASGAIFATGVTRAMNRDVTLATTIGFVDWENAGEKDVNVLRKEIIGAAKDVHSKSHVGEFVEIHMAEPMLATTASKSVTVSESLERIQEFQDKRNSIANVTVGEPILVRFASRLDAVMEPFTDGDGVVSVADLHQEKIRQLLIHIETLSVNISETKVSGKKLCDLKEQIQEELYDNYLWVVLGAIQNADNDSSDYVDDLRNIQKYLGTRVWQMKRRGTDEQVQNLEFRFTCVQRLIDGDCAEVVDAYVNFPQNLDEFADLPMDSLDVVVDYLSEENIALVLALGVPNAYSVLTRMAHFLETRIDIDQEASLMSSQKSIPLIKQHALASDRLCIFVSQESAWSLVTNPNFDALKGFESVYIATVPDVAERLSPAQKEMVINYLKAFEEGLLVEVFDFHMNDVGDRGGLDKRLNELKAAYQSVGVAKGGQTLLEALWNDPDAIDTIENSVLLGTANFGGRNDLYAKLIEGRGSRLTSNRRLIALALFEEAIGWNVSGADKKALLREYLGSFLILLDGVSQEKHEETLIAVEALSESFVKDVSIPFEKGIRASALMPRASELEEAFISLGAIETGSAHMDVFANQMLIQEQKDLFLSDVLEAFEQGENFGRIILIARSMQQAFQEAGGVDVYDELMCELHEMQQEKGRELQNTFLDDVLIPLMREGVSNKPVAMQLFSQHQDTYLKLGLFDLYQELEKVLQAEVKTQDQMSIDVQLMAQQIWTPKQVQRVLIEVPIELIETQADVFFALAAKEIQQRQVKGEPIDRLVARVMALGFGKDGKGLKPFIDRGICAKWPEVITKRLDQYWSKEIQKLQEKVVPLMDLKDPKQTLKAFDKLGPEFAVLGCHDQFMAIKEEMWLREFMLDLTSETPPADVALYYRTAQRAGLNEVFVEGIRDYFIAQLEAENTENLREQADAGSMLQDLYVAMRAYPELAGQLLPRTAAEVEALQAVEEYFAGAELDALHDAMLHIPSPGGLQKAMVHRDMDALNLYKAASELRQLNAEACAYIASIDDVMLDAYANFPTSMEEFVDDPGRVDMLRAQLSEENMAMMLALNAPNAREIFGQMTDFLHAEHCLEMAADGKSYNFARDIKALNVVRARLDLDPVSNEKYMRPLVVSSSYSAVIGRMPEYVRAVANYEGIFTTEEAEMVIDRLEFAESELLPRAVNALVLDDVSEKVIKWVTELTAAYSKLGIEKENLPARILKKDRAAMMKFLFRVPMTEETKMIYANAIDLYVDEFKSDERLLALAVFKEAIGWNDLLNNQPALFKENLSIFIKLQGEDVKLEAARAIVASVEEKVGQFLKKDDDRGAILALEGFREDFEALGMTESFEAYGEVVRKIQDQAYLKDFAAGNISFDKAIKEVTEEGSKTELRRLQSELGHVLQTRFMDEVFNPYFEGESYDASVESLKLMKEEYFQLGLQDVYVQNMNTIKSELAVRMAYIVDTEILEKAEDSQAILYKIPVKTIRSNPAYMTTFMAAAKRELDVVMPELLEDISVMQDSLLDRLDWVLEGQEDEALVHYYRPFLDDTVATWPARLEERIKEIRVLEQKVGPIVTLRETLKPYLEGAITFAEVERRMEVHRADFVKIGALKTFERTLMLPRIIDFMNNLTNETPLQAIKDVKLQAHQLGLLPECYTMFAARLPGFEGDKVGLVHKFGAPSEVPPADDILAQISVEKLFTSFTLTKEYGQMIAVRGAIEEVRKLIDDFDGTNSAIILFQMAELERAVGVTTQTIVMREEGLKLVDSMDKAMELLKSAELDRSTFGEQVVALVGEKSASKLVLTYDVLALARKKEAIVEHDDGMHSVRVIKGRKSYTATYEVQENGKLFFKVKAKGGMNGHKNVPTWQAFATTVLKKL